MISPIEHLSHEQMLASPAQDVPVGKLQDLVNPVSMRHGAEVALFIICTLISILVLLRICVQLRVARTFYVEDYTMLLTWAVFTGAYMPMGILLAHAPMGVHQWDITVRDFAHYLFLQYLEFIVWGILILLLRIAIILQYLRFFTPSGIRDFTFWALLAVLWGNAAYYVAFTFIFIFACHPREYFWDKTIPHGKCLDIFEMNVISAAVCVLSDLTVLILPLVRVYQLRLTAKRKFGLGLLFAIGTFACATSSVRLYYNIQLWLHQQDITYQLGVISFWGTSQIPAGFSIVCLPSLPKAINWARSETFFSGLMANLHSRLPKPTGARHVSNQQPNPIDEPQVQNPHANVISDVEFHNLVNKVDTLY